MKDDYNKYIIEAKVYEVFKALNDIILDHIEDDSLTAKSMALSILDLKDESGKDIFKLDNNYQFDAASLRIFELARKQFEDTILECKDILEAEDLVKIQSTLNLLEKTLKVERIVKPMTKVRFITIPVKGKSALENDLDGKATLVEFAGKKHMLTSPHRFEFKLSHPSEVSGLKNGEMILKELAKIENVLAEDPCIVKHTGKKMPFQSEYGSQVKKFTSSELRIMLNQYGTNTVMISGIFHKVGQNDESVQNEYKNRQSIIDDMKNDLNVSVEECEKLYYDFKLELIKGLYGDKISTMEAVHRYMLESTLEKEEEVTYSEGRGL